LSDNHLAFIFPAFASDFDNHAGQSLAGFNNLFTQFLDRAIKSADPGLSGFSFSANVFSANELRTQYLTYIYSCAAASALRNNGFTPGINAGYSMGIYAALHDAGALFFETGLELIGLAYQTLCKSTGSGLFNMGTIIGLTRNDIDLLINGASLRAEITNQNASHAFVVSGYRDDIHKLLLLATQEGALNVRSLNVSIPYHASVLQESALRFAQQIGKTEIMAPHTPVVSLIDQVLLNSEESVRTELFRNLFQPLNWYQTMRFMLAGHINLFVECGPEKGLAKNARFIEGDFNFHSLNNLRKPEK
jgi:[acyl-carrier-protein] S-malonyltransferase